MIPFQEANFYGAADNVFSIAKPKIFKATWVHGIGFMFSDYIDPNTILHPDEKWMPLHLVNNKDIELILTDNGFNAKAVGCPFIYNKYYDSLPSSRKFKRIFFPQHSVNGWDYTIRANQWVQLAKKYKCDAVCLTDFDYTKLISLKIRVGDLKLIKGASIKDKNAINYIASIFQSTYEIVSDNVGSYLAYAALSGCKIHIIDEYVESIVDTSSKEFRNYLHTYKKSERNSFLEFEKKNHLNTLKKRVWFTGNYKLIKEYSEFIAGCEFKKTNKSIAEMLCPESTYQAYLIYLSLLTHKIKKRIYLL